MKTVGVISTEKNGVRSQLAAQCWSILRTWKDIPKAKSLITRASHYRAAVGGHGQVQHSHGVAHQGANLLHFGVLPNVNLVE